MAYDTEVMKKILVKEVVPELRQHGFSGSFPHFRRHKGQYIDLLSFQFDRYGGGFVVELAKCLNEVEKNGFDMITAQQVNDKRARLSPNIQLGNDYWFRNIYKDIANEVARLFADQAEAWWSDENNVSSQEYLIDRVTLRKVAKN